MCGWCCGGVSMEKRGEGHKSCSIECYNAPPRKPSNRRATQRTLSKLEELAVTMSGVGAHRDPCRLPDTECLCGLCDFRVEAAELVRSAAQQLRDALGHESG